jgi:hypothetical protein
MITFPFQLMNGILRNAFKLNHHRDTGETWENLMEALFVPGTYASCFLIRDTLLQNNTFGDALTRLAYTSIAAPIYFILAGNRIFLLVNPSVKC